MIIRAFLLPLFLLSNTMLSWCVHHCHVRHNLSSTRCTYWCVRSVIVVHALSMSCSGFVIVVGALFIFMPAFCVLSLLLVRLSVFKHGFCYRHGRVVHIHAWASFRHVNSFTRHYHHCGSVVAPLVSCSYYLHVIPFHEGVLLPCIESFTRDHHHLGDIVARLPCHYYHSRVAASSFFESTGSYCSTVQFALNKATLFTAKLKSFGSSDLVRKQSWRAFAL